MKLALFGATGRTGHLLLEQALASGHEVSALIRDSNKISGRHERLKLLEGNAHDASKVEAVVADAEVVLCTLGHTATSAKDVLAVSMKHILSAMTQTGVRRLIVETGAGLRDKQDPPPSVGDRVMVRLLLLFARDMFEDAGRQAELIRASDLDWVLVRAPRLTNKPRTGDYRAGYLKLGPKSNISRADVADFMLRQISEDTYLKQAPMISA